MPGGGAHATAAIRGTFRRGSEAGATTLSITILVVDDSAFSRAVISDVLRGAGYTTMVAEHGEAALALLSSPAGPAVDVAVLDVEMPRMDGRQFLAVLRAQARFTSLPVVLVTGSPERAPQEGALCILDKPFAPDDLLNAVTYARQLGHRGDADA